MHLVLGPQKTLNHQELISNSFDVSIAAVSFFLALYYFSLYMNGFKGRDIGYSILEFIGIAIMSLFVGEKFIYKLIPNLKLEYFIKIQSFSIILVPFAICGFTNATNKRTIPDRLFKLAKNSFLIYTAIIIVSPYRIYIFLNQLLYLPILVLYIKIIKGTVKEYCMLKEKKYERRNVLLYFFCVLFVTTHYISNLLYGWSILFDKRLFIISIVMFLILSQFFLAFRFARNNKILVENELAFLHAQIKPHFIYNTLNTVVSFCYTDGEAAAKLLTNFSNYLRLTFDIDNSNMKTSISREIDLVKAYIEIQNARFAGKYKVNYKIDPKALSFKIPPLIVQPLIENSVKHGFSMKEDNCIIDIKISFKDEFLFITVADNGLGMSKEKLNILRSKDEVHEGVGLWNVNKRLSQMKDSSLLIESDENIGTKAIIKIKKVSGKNDESNYS